MKQQRGQSSIEYVIVCTVLVFALGLGMSDPDAALPTWIKSLENAYHRLAYSLSIPS